LFFDFSFLIVPWLCHAFSSVLSQKSACGFSRIYWALVHIAGTGCLVAGLLQCGDPIPSFVEMPVLTFTPLKHGPDGRSAEIPGAGLAGARFQHDLPLPEAPAAAIPYRRKNDVPQL